MLWKIAGFDPTPLLKDTTAKLKVTITARDVIGNLITAQDKALSQDDVGFYYPGLLGPQDHLKRPA